MSKVGYIRVSAIDQNTERQEVALKELNVNKIFTTLVKVSVESPFTFVRGFFDKRYLFPKKTGRIREQTTNKPQT